jgi:hypothetical protein
MKSQTLMNFIFTVSKPGLRERSQDLLLNEVVISSKKEYSTESNLDDVELPLFDFSTLAMATNNFSDENKLGQGGFGSVYKVIFFVNKRYHNINQYYKGTQYIMLTVVYMGGIARVGL